MPSPSDDSCRDRARLFDYLDRLKLSITEGDTESARAFRDLLLAALDQAGARTMKAEASGLLERASGLFSQVYATIPLGPLRLAIDAWEQDYLPLRSVSASGVTPLRALHALLTSTPVEALTPERLRELHGLLDGSYRGDTVVAHWGCITCAGTAIHAPDCARRAEPLPPDPFPFPRFDQP
jgi:hypothetical protein